MSRLTERKLNGDIVVSGKYIFHPHTLWFNIVDKLAYYEDLEEQDKLIEVQHGYWEPIEVGGITTLFSCSICQRKIEIGNDYYGKPTRHVASHYPYCHCGAKMEE